jgi:hypothetical protein
VIKLDYSIRLINSDTIPEREFDKNFRLTFMDNVVLRLDDSTDTGDFSDIASNQTIFLIR